MDIIIPDGPFQSNFGGPYDNSLPLHKAIADNDAAALESLLCQPNVNVNMQDALGNTPLSVSLRRNRSNSIIMQLLRAGCDVKICDCMNVTPLHLAMFLDSAEIVHELIKRGADTNALCNYRSINYIHGSFQDKRTAMHLAVMHNNLQGICVLLYYGADVYVNYVKTLINYYDVSYFIDETSLIFEDFCLRDVSEVKCITVLFVNSFRCKSPEIANILRNHMNFVSNLNNHDFNVLLFAIIEDCQFSTPDWLEYLFLILNEFIARGFLIHCIPLSCTFFYYLMHAFNERSIESAARLRIINICLSLAALPYTSDLVLMHMLYGFGEELEVFIYAGPHFEDYSNTFVCDDNTLWNNFICSANTSPENFINIFSTLPHSFRLCNRVGLIPWIQPNYLTTLLGFFSVSLEMKQKIRNLCHSLSPTEQQEISEKLDQLPESPTLVELCRNQIRKIINQKNKFKYEYHFHDAVKKLNAPKTIEDMIRFKRCLF